VFCQLGKCVAGDSSFIQWVFKAGNDEKGGFEFELNRLQYEEALIVGRLTNLADVIQFIICHYLPWALIFTKGQKYNNK